MDYSYILNKSLPQKEKLLAFGFLEVEAAFVGQIRSEVQDVIEEIREKCFISQDIKEKYVDFLQSLQGNEF